MEISYDDAITSLKLVECCECRERLLAADCYSPICNRGYAVRLAIEALEEKKAHLGRITCKKCVYCAQLHYQDGTTDAICTISLRNVDANDFCSCCGQAIDGSDI